MLFKGNETVAMADMGCHALPGFKFVLSIALILLYNWWECDHKMRPLYAIYCLLLLGTV